MKPGSPEWSRLVTASKVAAILGLSPWDSPLTMWHVMRGDLPSDSGRNADAKARGHYLEEGVIQWWRDQHPEVVGPSMAQHFREKDGWAASTPDLYVQDDGYGNRVVVDAKTAASDDDWGDEPPAYYIAAAMWQMWTHDADLAYVAVLFGRPQLAFAEYPIQRDDDLIAGIVARCREFYDSLTSDVAPPLSGLAAEYDAIRKVHPEIDRGASVTLPADLADLYLSIQAHEAHSDAVKARVLDHMGRAQYADHPNGQRIARRQPHGEAVSLRCAIPKKALTLPTTESENAA